MNGPHFADMYVAAGDSRLVCVAGTVKPINCGNAKIAALLAVAPTLHELLAEGEALAMISKDVPRARWKDWQRRAAAALAKVAQ